MSRRDALTLTTACFAQFAAVISISTTALALPHIALQFHSTLQTLQWVLGVYVIVLACGLMFAGTCADRFGRKRVLIAGLVVFALGSALCAVAADEVGLLLARVVQGMGGAMIPPAALGTITAAFARNRSTAFAWWATVSGVGLAVGSVLGGAVIDIFGWRGTFWLGVVLALPAALLCLFLRESKSRTPRPFDPVGLGLLPLGFASLMSSLIGAQTSGWLDPLILVGLATSAAAFTGLALVERRRAEPMLPVRRMRDRGFACALGVAVLAYAANGALMFTLSLELQSVRHLDATASGAFLATIGVAAVVAALVSGRLVARGQLRRAFLASGALLMATSALMRPAELGPSVLLVLPLVLFGLGYAVVNDPANTVAARTLAAEDAALAGSTMSTARQVGQLLGIAIAGGMLHTRLAADLVTGFRDASPFVWGFLGLCGIGVAVLGLIGTAGRRRSPRAA